MPILTPDNYKSNLQWLKKANNKIDTVTLSIDNGGVGSYELLSTQTITSGYINKSLVQLPVSDDTVSPYIRTQVNMYGGNDYARSRVEALMLNGTTEFTLDTPLYSTPNITFDFTGKSFIIPRKQATLTDIPSVSELKDFTKSFVSTIKNNSRVTESDSLTWSFNKFTLLLSQWLNKNLPDDTQAKAEDVSTEWCPPSALTYASDNGWENYESDALKDLSYDDAKIYHPNTTNLGRRLAYRYTQIPVTVNVTKLSQLKYEVSWSMPIRYLYMAISSYEGPYTQGRTLWDSFAFVDIIESITINLYGSKYRTEKVDRKYSLSDSNTLTDIPKNQHIFNIPYAECFTLQTQDTSTSPPVAWYQKLPLLLLQKYKNGKYFITVEADAIWCLDNNIHIGSEIQIRLLTGKLITNNNGTPKTFRVRNIDKIFNASEFIFRINLMEE